MRAHPRPDALWKTGGQTHARNQSRIRRKVRFVLLVFVGSAAALVAETSAQTAARTNRASVSSAGVEGNSFSFTGAISASGRFAAFYSVASNLVARDTNRVADVFVRDRRTGTTRRISVSSAGAEGNGASEPPAISATGRFVAFSSDASNLVRGDTNGASDAFVHDRRTGTTRRVSVSSPGAEGNGGSGSSAISANGRFVLFASLASNLVAGDTNGRLDVFVHDRWTGTTERVSVSSAGTEADASSIGAAISANGRFVVFASGASNLVAGDTNGESDLFVRDRRTGTTERVSVSSAGTEANAFSDEAAISANGRFVAFSSLASNLVARDTNERTDVFVRDRRTGTTRRISVSSAGAQANALSEGPTISANGIFVGFWSFASNLVARDRNGNADVFVRDRRTGTTRRVSVSSGGAEGNGGSGSPAMSANGRFVAFDSSASNLVARDRNGVNDVFVRGPLGRR